MKAVIASLFLALRSRDRYLLYSLVGYMVSNSDGISVTMVNGTAPITMNRICSLLNHLIVGS